MIFYTGSLPFTLLSDDCFGSYCQSSYVLFLKYVVFQLDLGWETNLIKLLHNQEIYATQPQINCLSDLPDWLQCQGTHHIPRTHFNDPLWITIDEDPFYDL